MPVFLAGKIVTSAAIADKCKGGRTVHSLDSSFEHGGGFFNINRYPAHGVDNIDNTVELNADHIGHIDPEISLNHICCGFETAAGLVELCEIMSGVDAVFTDTRDGDPQIARNGEQAHLRQERRHGRKDHGIAAAGIGTLGHTVNTDGEDGCAQGGEEKEQHEQDDEPVPYRMRSAPCVISNLFMIGMRCVISWFVLILFHALILP